MAITPGGAAPAIAELVLKTTPPRAPRHLLVRPRLSLDDEQFRDRSIILVQAPPGFGKTSLLAQWRHEYLAKGSAVAWISAEGSPDPQRMLYSLVLAVRMGCGRPNFGATLLEGLAATVGEFEGITAWLSEVAQASLSLVLMIDEGDRMSANVLASLDYLLHNAPPNLRVVVAGRGDLNPMVADLRAYGHCASVGVETLRFTLEETMSLVRNRIGAKADPDTCARLHDMTEGWPLGLQLLLAAMERGSDPRSVVGAHSPTSRNQLVDALTAKLAPEDVAFLTRIAIVDQLHPELCVALTGDEESPQRLARLARDTPIFVVGEDSDWYRLHLLASDALRSRLAELPEQERNELHGRAQVWLASHGMLTPAARHAREAGHEGVAFDLAQQGLYEAVTQGHTSTMRDWLEVLPESVLDQHPQLRLAAAWALAVSERHEEAERMVGLILSRPDVDFALRYECVLIASGAAYYADDPDRCVAMFAPWSEVPAGVEPKFRLMHVNRLAMLALLQGDPAEARRRLLSLSNGEFPPAADYVVRWGEFIVGLSYLWEGQLLLGEEGLRLALASIDAKLGRRHPLACMFASLLATVAYERDRVDEAVALLANRLDVLERVGAPEAMLVGYRTATRVAAAQGEEHRALDLLEASYAIGVARRLPRLCVASLGEQVRLHAGRFRRETCNALIARMEELISTESPRRGPLWRRNVEMLTGMAYAYAAMAAQDWPGVIEAVSRAAPLAEQARLGRFRIECMALRAFALDRNGEDGRVLLLEAMSLARTYGYKRIFVDTHPVLSDWAYRVAEEGGGAADTESAPARVVNPPADLRQGGPRVVPSMVLTPKEREVLELLARNLSNKEIAQAMAVGEATIKWHLKNLFGKLGVGTRRHVVHRAQLLGLLQGLE
ncbi:LuxR family transcriptional regulator [Dyella solisilvae]|uniref:LuxR family transcriptional regulator n=1 Tax=Dyella solisilvae TaxID=1920168 RepID=A0A370KB49_9GAMM|nr:LuxR C-terminal-related transcriptional regulator [Dyella solisilvae]RDI99687.1 LuxR family transcriptional regulator [Dyella solisilvae]